MKKHLNAVEIKKQLDFQKEMDEIYQFKLNGLNFSGLKREEKEKLIFEVQKYFGILSKQFYKQWKELELSIGVIDFLEERIVKMGGDIKDIRKEFVAINDDAVKLLR